ncbi:MAG: MFS transporter [Clostridia bacterium]|nr:MFS transporter [Clostridia bacterium]
MKQKAITPAVDPSQRVPLKEKLFFGAADIFGGGAQALIAAVYLAFLVNNGVSIEKAGLIVMLAKIWDAISDPLMGAISDNTRTKWGRRRPYLFAGGVLIVIAFALLFLPLYGMENSALRFSIYLLTYVFYSTVSTVINVPYTSMSTEISTDISEKTKTNSIRLVFSMVSSGISALAPIILIEQLQDGILKVGQFSLIMIFAFGILYCVPLVLASIFCKERADIPKIKTKFQFKIFLKPLKVKAFVYFLLSYLFAFTCMDLITANIVFFADYGLKLNMSSSILLIVIMLSYAAMVPVLYKLLAKGWAKAKLFRLGIPLYIIGIVCLCLYPSSWPSWPVVFCCVIIGIGLSGCQMMPWILFPDIVDVGELKLKERIAGSFSGIMTFIRKATSAIAIGITSWVLSWEMVGFRQPVTDYLTGIVTKFEQPMSAVWGLRMIVMVPVVIFISLAFYFSSKIKLDNKRSLKVKEFIDMQNRGELDIDKLSEEDRTIYKAIEKELF